MSNGRVSQRPEYGGSQMLKILSVCAVLSFLLVSSAMAQNQRPARRISKKPAPTEKSCPPSALPLASRSMSQTFPTCARQRLAYIVAAGKTCRADVQQQCGTERQRIQKVACIGKALSNFSHDCKAAVAAVATRRKNKQAGSYGHQGVAWHFADDKALCNAAACLTASRMTASGI